ncbi:MAG: class II aldolase/adducin family protein [Deinococcales bacterium]
MTLADLAREVSNLHAYLPANNLVSWTSGNLSGRLPQAKEMVIKPSGVLFEDLSPDKMCVVDIDTLACKSTYKYSSDTATHAYIYKHLPEVGGIVHTHSPYATAWAAVGKEIPCFLTAMADEFGGPIPLGGFALIGGEEIGQEVVKVLKGHNSPAIIMQNHGVSPLAKRPKPPSKQRLCVRM